MDNSVIHPSTQFQSSIIPDQIESSIIPESHSDLVKFYIAKKNLKYNCQDKVKSNNKQ